RVISFVKNQNLGLVVPYLMGSTKRRYLPDFIVQIDDGKDDPLNLIVEVKGYRGEDAKIKAETMRTYWVPGVNNLKSFGRWAFTEFTAVYQMEDEFEKLIAGLTAKVEETA
ncbi:MAG: restriction endonuclease, partial [Paracoccaceae bacterium]